MHDQQLIKLFRELTGNNPLLVGTLKQGGSGRHYYRLQDSNDTVVGCVNENIPENEAFFHLSDVFYNHGLNVPEVLKIDSSRQVYLQTDCGDNSFYDKIINRTGQKINGELTDLYKKSLIALINFQTTDQSKIDASKYYPLPVFNAQSIQWDLNYFKYYFLNLHDIHYNELKLHNDFDALSSFVLNDNMQHFMYRDFQSRNILIRDNEPWFIDFQGGRRGPLAYDVVSLLYQAKANLSENDREMLLRFYIDELGKKIDFDEKTFLDYYTPVALIRLLQVLGAYGFRGLYQRKSHFLSSIGLAIDNLKQLMTRLVALNLLPELQRCLELLIEKAAIYEPVKNDKFRLVIKSFSYLNGSMPMDISGHGGGYIFDCRLLPNPGREPEFRDITGMDEPVQKYFAHKPEVQKYIDDATRMAAAHIEQFLKRGFRYMSVNFGCTGGRHRSVFCAEKSAQILKNMYPDIQVEVQHVMQHKSYIC